MSQFVANRLSLPFERPQLNRQQLTVVAAITTMLTLLMTYSGACNTSDLALAHRLVLWTVVCGLVVLQVVGLAATLRATLPPSGRLFALPDGLAVVLTITLVAVQLHWLKFTPLLPKKPDPALEFLLFVTPLVGSVAIMTLVAVNSVADAQRRIADDVARRTRSGVDTNGFTAVVDWPDATILRVSVEDHYLSIHTARGVSLIRGRMNDALDRLANENGFQVHRSHWVAVDQIERIVRRGRDCRVVLLDGTSLPVARSRLAAIRAIWQRSRTG